MISEDIRRFECGGISVVGLKGVSKIISRYNELGADDMEQYCLSLVDYLYDRMEKELKKTRVYGNFRKENRSSIVTLAMPAEWEMTDEETAKSDTRTHCPAEGLLRIRFHFYNNIEDVDRLVGFLKTCERGEEQGQVAVSTKEQLKELRIILPQVSKSSGSYIPAVALGYLLFTTGQVPRVNDIVKYKGKVGGDSTLEDAYVGARICMVNYLVAIKQAVGGLDRVARILKVNGCINAAPGFTQNPKVLDGVSDLLLEVFGNTKQHIRSAIGVQALSDNAVVEVEVIVPLKEPCEYLAV